MDPDGSAKSRLTRDPARDQGADWAPDGSRIVFESTRDDGHWDLFTMRADGSDVRQLTSGPMVEWAPTWSPDATRIAFTVARYSRRVEDIAVLNLDGTVTVRFTIPRTFELEPNWQPVPTSS
jgi:Tol biopolymer transport system component